MDIFELEERDYEKFLAHIGTPHEGSIPHSGRYPFGSGDSAYQHNKDFRAEVGRLKKEGFTYTDPETGVKYYGETAIARYKHMSTDEFRQKLSNARAYNRGKEYEEAKRLREDGYSYAAIAEKLDYPNESSVRSLLNEVSKERADKARATADFLKSQVDAKGPIFVGKGVEVYLGISETKKRNALKLLEEDGYYTYAGRVPQVTNDGKKTTISVLTPPDTPYKINADGKRVSAAVYDYNNIAQIDNVISMDGGETFTAGFQHPTSLDLSRVKIRYKDEVGEDGYSGSDRDGLIEIRRGVPDLYLGDGVNYAQVRVVVDDKYYLKGMAAYSDRVPDGYDVVFNCNKTPDMDISDVLKKLNKGKDGEVDWSNPFKSLIKEHGGQSYYTDPETGEQKLSLINKRADEGDWGEWAKKLPSQFLSKQNLSLAKQQLSLAEKAKKEEFDELNSLTNPTIKKEMLKEFAAGCDKDSITLSAAAVQGQKYQVILPVPSLKDNEIYAPNYENGSKVALVRYPHGGIFEIPVLTVNNNNAEGNEVITKTAKDAVGITPKTANQLSGADYDGDTVTVIPLSDTVAVSHKSALEGLGNFDPTEAYGTVKKTVQKVNKKTGEVTEVDEYYRDGAKVSIMTESYKQKQMGVVSNLITDMTLKGASDEELARAVRHSMVVIDAVKHKLDYKASEADNKIAELVDLYQVQESGHAGGSATLISRAKSEERVPARQGEAHINQKGKSWYDSSKEEGALVYTLAEKQTRVDYKTGKETPRTTTSTKMAETDDARTLISDADTPMERLYADYANYMKSMANEARRIAVYTEDIPYSRSSYEIYKADIDDLDNQLLAAKANKPRETAAQIAANAAIAAKIEAYPELKDKENKKDLKKVKQQELQKARVRCGSKRNTIELTDRQWEAIQAGAISKSKLEELYQYLDKDVLKERAMPRSSKTLSNTQIQMIKNFAAKGNTIAEIAERFGISASTVQNYLSSSTVDDD